MTKPNCYECRWRRDIPGDCHSRCVHPEFDTSDFFEFFGNGLVKALSTLKIKGNRYGYEQGWFLQF